MELNQHGDSQRAGIGQSDGASHSWQGIMSRVVDNGLGALSTGGYVLVCVCWYEIGQQEYRKMF